MEKKYKGDVMVRFWNSGNPLIGEFYNPHITKGKALEDIRKYYNIPKEKTISFVLAAQMPSPKPFLISKAYHHLRNGLSHHTQGEFFPLSFVHFSE